MKWTTQLVVIVMFAGLTASAPAGIFSKKAPKADPVQRVPELLYTVKMEPEEAKRVAAATELRQYDSKMFPDVVPILADVVRNDKSPVVRQEALNSLGKIRPVSAMAGEAIEEAAKDPVARVRMQAWTSLKLYRFAGYRGSPKADGPTLVPVITDSASGKGPSAAKGLGEFQMDVVKMPEPKEQPATEQNTMKNFVSKLGFRRPGASKANPPPSDAGLPAGLGFSTASPGSASNPPRPLPATPGFSTAIQSTPPRATPPIMNLEPPSGAPPSPEPPRADPPR
jgi:hypothetical protein